MQRLYRSRENRMIAGIAGGLAEYFNVDPVFVRLLWILSIFIGGSGLIAYLIGWLIIPERNTGETTPEERDEKGLQAIGLLLIIGGVALFLRYLIPLPWFRFFWPLALVALGIFLIWRANQDNQ